MNRLGVVSLPERQSADGTLDLVFLTINRRLKSKQNNNVCKQAEVHSPKMEVSNRVAHFKGCSHLRRVERLDKFLSELYFASTNASGIEYGPSVAAPFRKLDTPSHDRQCHGTVLHALSACFGVAET